MDEAYPDHVSVSDRTIDSHVKRIRRKFLVVDPAFDGIEGVYGAGYRYRRATRMTRDCGDAAAWRPSRIGLRLLAFNLLVVFLPVAGVLYLDVYETRLLAGAGARDGAAGAGARRGAGRRRGLDRDALNATLARLGRRGDARLRVFDASGTLVADSDRVAADPVAVAPATYPAEPAGAAGTRRRILYRVGAAMANARDAVSAIVRSWIVGAPGEGTAPRATL